VEGHDDGRPVDAGQLLRFSESLREGFALLAQADIRDASRERWQRRLIAITNAAKRDLDRAEEQYARYREDFDREVGAGEAGPR
jgi:hypothetical protein